MSLALSFFVLNNVRFSRCREAVDVARAHKDDLFILCGGIGECLELLEVARKCYGIPNIYDDEYIIKMLKEKKFFIGGKLARVDNVCIAGIDAKNPVQAVEKITSNGLDNCHILILVSVYPLPISRCAKITFRNKEIAIGLPVDLLEKILGLTRTTPTIIISCQEYSAGVCLDTLDKNALYISIPQTITVARITLDIQRLSLISMSYL